MAQYQDGQYLQQVKSSAYDSVHEPGTKATNAGIYRCVKCGHEIGIAQGHTLPPEIHPNHPASLGPIQWKLLVFAQHNK